MSRMIDFCDISCDECGNWEPGRFSRTRLQRRYLRKHRGWTTRGRKDICPNCILELGIKVKEKA